ncbi:MULTISPECIES: hypothetical protein [Rhizobium]|uniref:Uncharacterized protein n=1 Tax=Rhizobium tropici TaxID=398 RepID=A0A6P1C257_RHITR|nr:MULTISPECIES: hypothetical protein [Rhizobium]MBB4245483.1 hypothetical protein [Rhizobium tropici]MBB5595853.1 hypothetical protein [Rhizobium tropici]MBB6493845.1 hypothetical protein [Rhizobium tropici]NEV11289.1 hypothetical protein [Rhizobium tropici]TGE93147.1 hypothetical protein C9417_26795 [Rhizobium sp. SEMIA 4088]
MTAQIVAAWATLNGFDLLESGKYRRTDDARTLTIEIKKLSVVFIDERAGLRPRVNSTLFKDLLYGSPNNRLERLFRGI